MEDNTVFSGHTGNGQTNNMHQGAHGMGFHAPQLSQYPQQQGQFVQQQGQANYQQYGHVGHPNQQHYGQFGPGNHQHNHQQYGQFGPGNHQQYGQFGPGNHQQYGQFGQHNHQQYGQFTQGNHQQYSQFGQHNHQPYGQYWGPHPGINNGMPPASVAGVYPNAHVGHPHNIQSSVAPGNTFSQGPVHGMETRFNQSGAHIPTPNVRGHNHRRGNRRPLPRPGIRVCNLEVHPQLDNFRPRVCDPWASSLVNYYKLIWRNTPGEGIPKQRHLEPAPSRMSDSYHSLDFDNIIDWNLTINPLNYTETLLYHERVVPVEEKIKNVKEWVETSDQWLSTKFEVDNYLSIPWPVVPDSPTSSTDVSSFGWD